MAAIRNARLDEHCEEIGSALDTQSTARKSEKGERQAALPIMQRLNIGRYQHAGVLLTRTPGTDKLSVKRVDEEGDASEIASPVVQGDDEGHDDADAGQGDGDSGDEGGES